MNRESHRHGVRLLAARVLGEDRWDEGRRCQARDPRDSAGSFTLVPIPKDPCGPGAPTTWSSRSTRWHERTELLGWQSCDARPPSGAVMIASILTVSLSELATEPRTSLRLAVEPDILRPEYCGFLRRDVYLDSERQRSQCSFPWGSFPNTPGSVHSGGGG